MKARHGRHLFAKDVRRIHTGGQVVAEWLVNDDHTGPPAGAIFGVNMLVNTDDGDTFSFADEQGWLEEAGFQNVRTIECPGPSPLILATKN